MVQNRVRKLRTERKLTQKALAEKVGTSQQQIQRVEAGIHAIRLDFAAKVASALDVELSQAFPNLGKVRKGRRERRESLIDVQKMPEAGIDPDPRHWTLKFFMF